MLPHQIKASNVCLVPKYLVIGNAKDPNLSRNTLKNITMTVMIVAIVLALTIKPQGN